MDSSSFFFFFFSVASACAKCLEAAGFTDTGVRSLAGVHDVIRRGAKRDV